MFLLRILQVQHHGGMLALLTCKAAQVHAVVTNADRVWRWTWRLRV